MQASVIVARIVGPVFVVIGIGILANLSLYAAAVADAVRSTTLIFLAGLLCLAAGVAILNAHRAWTADWRVIITLIGWVFVLAGIVRIVFPQLAATLAPAFYSGPIAMAIPGIVVLLLGGFLSFEGYRR
jgi:hypothetical protein